MRIVMTGATSGFGLDAAARLVEAGVDSLVIGARTPHDLPEELQVSNVTAHWLDLEDFASVRTFADVIGDDPIDVLALNAGIGLPRPERVDNGMDKTFVVNQLAPFLLLDLLRDRLAPDARVIFTGSIAHDPATGMMVPPNHADAKRLAYPENDHGKPRGALQQSLRAYASSKLANIMTARELARRAPGLTVLAFDPGVVSETRITRDFPAYMRLLNAALAPIVAFSKHSSTLGNTGRLFALLMVDRAHDGERGAYWSVRGKRTVLVEPSALARDKQASAQLWDDCMDLLDRK